MDGAESGDRVPISARHGLRRVIVGGTALLMIGTLVYMCLPGIESRPAAPVAVCRSNLHNIMLALQNYHADYGSFPPAYTVDADGRPLHSWRTLILPYLDWASLYERMRLDEPRNSPHNRKLTDQVGGLSIFACPSDVSGAARPNQANFLAVVGPETMWPGGESRKLEEVTDDAHQTIVLVEVAGSGIDFFEPRDLNFDELSFKTNDPDRPSPRSAHRSSTGGWWQPGKPPVNAGFADGSVRPLPESIAPGTLRALLTINGGETVKGFR